VTGERLPIRLVAGLGNPGPEYAFTRHNVGFLVLDRLASRLGVAWEMSSKWGAATSKIGPLILIKPMTYMNRSGEPLAAVADFYKISPEETLVVTDDMALPLGRLRMRLEGGTGGHNGLESVICEFATENIPRLRVGIGVPPPDTAVDHVLGRFFEEEKPKIEAAVEKAAEAVKCAIDNGLVSAMNTFNKAEEL
jgi:PTH1 family peptidyl-tRNA hydrolase